MEAFCETQSKVSQPDVLQDTHADLFFLVQSVYHKPKPCAAKATCQSAWLAGLQEAARPFLEAFCEAQSKVSQPDVLQDTHADLLFFAVSAPREGVTLTLTLSLTGGVKG